MKKLFLPAMLVMMPFILMAQISLSGKVTNRVTHESLPGAHIRLLNSYYSTASSSDGKFMIKNIKPSVYSLVVSYLGYKSDTLITDLNQSTDLKITLLPTSILEDEIIVYATRAGSNTPVAYQNMDKKEIASLNFGQDLPILLGNSISSVATSDAGNGMGYTALRIRGTDMTRINVTINGIPLNDPESHNVYWVDLPDFASSTDNIQIQRGVGTSTNGASSFGASINLQSASLKTGPYSEISSAYGSFNTFKNSISFGSGLFNKHFSMDARISKLSSDGYIDRASSDLLSYFVSGAYSSEKDLLRFNLFTGKEKTYQAWDGVPSDILKTNRTYNGIGAYTDNAGVDQHYDNETDNYTQTHYQVLYSHEFNNRFFLNTSLHHTVGAGYYEQYKENDKLANYSIDPILLQSPFYIIGTDTTFVPDKKIKRSDLIRQKHLANAYTGLTWSLNYHYKQLHSAVGGSWNTFTGNHFGKVIWMQFASNSENNHEWYRSKAIKKDFNLFAKSELALTEKLNTWIDLQYRNINYSINGFDDDLRDITQEHDFNFFNPKLGISYIISGKQLMYTSFSVAKREPNRDNFVDADPSKLRPTPENLYDFEAGYSITSSKITFNANAYYMYYKDQLVLTGAINDVGSPVMINVPKSYRAGIEISAKTLITNKLKWEPSITLSQNKINTFTEYIDDWDTWGQIAVDHTNTDLAFSPSVTANSNLSLNVNNSFSLTLLSKYVGKQFIDNTQSTDRMLDAYFVNNLLIKYNIHPGFVKEIGLSMIVNNIFNEKYESNAWVYRYSSENTLSVLDGYFPQAGINFMIGANVKF